MPFASTESSFQLGKYRLRPGEERLQRVAQQLRIDTQGRVFEDQRAAGQLRLMRFEHPEALVPVGDGLFRAPAEAASPVDAPRVRQGHLENGNLQTAAEMVRLIETMRHYEAGQKLIQGVDEILGRAIRTLGEY